MGSKLCSLRLVRCLPRGQRKSLLLSSSTVLSHEINMLAIAVLLVLSVTAQAAKYDYGSYRPSYESDRYGRDVYEHSMYKRSTAEGREGLEGLTGFARTVAEVATVLADSGEREGQQVSGCVKICDPFGLACARICGGR